MSSLTIVRLFSHSLERKRSEELLRVSEERYQLAVKGSNDGIWERDLLSNTAYYSPRYKELLGYSEGDDFPPVLESFSSKLHPDDRDRAMQAARQHLETQQPYHVEHRLQTKSGSFRWFVSRGQAIWDAGGGTPVRMAGSISDIDERKNAETELAKHREHLELLVEERTLDLGAARDEAERSSRAKSEFLSRMSHELRTPMNAVLGFGQWLQIDADGFSKSQRGNVNEILDAGHHLLNLINEVLDLATIESGKVEMSMEEVLIRDLLQQTNALIGPQGDARQLKLIDNISAKGYTVRADPTRLKQVLLNLLSNAVKYNRVNGCITMDAEVIGGHRLRICITDSGKGMTKEEIAKLFTPFERLNKTANVEGTGIGLVITKYLIELMGGAIGVESIPGTGSTFWVELALSSSGKEATSMGD